MILTWIIAAAAVAIVHLCCLNISAAAAIGVFAAGFVAANFLFLLYLIIAGMTVNTEKPLEKKNNLCSAACHRIIEYCCTYFRADVVMTGKEKIPVDTRFLIVSNHRSGFDPLTLGFVLKEYEISFISKPSNMKLPVIGKVAYGGAYLPIDRENDRNALRTILTAANYIKSDFCSVGIYPEGTRNHDTNLLPFHAGSFKIAQKASVPVVVAATRGAENIMRNAPFRKTKVFIDIVDVISADDVKASSTIEIAERAKKAIENRLLEVSDI